MLWQGDKNDEDFDSIGDGNDVEFVNQNNQDNDDVDSDMNDRHDVDNLDSDIPDSPANEKDDDFDRQNNEQDENEEDFKTQNSHGNIPGYCASVAPVTFYPVIMLCLINAGREGSQDSQRTQSIKRSTRPS